MEVYALKDFYKEATRRAVEDDDLCGAVERAEDGLVEARLGKFLIKQRIARTGQGKSKGFRAIILYKTGNIAVFLHMFSKNNQGNLTTES